MQNAKDTMYGAMRTRLAAINPDRTVGVRGATRPAVLVAENELAAATLPLACFVMSWSAANVDAEGALPLVTMLLEIRYATSGTAANAGMDRGRTLAAMDAELLAMVNTAPQTAAKTDYSGLEFGHAASATGTAIWWSDLALGKTTSSNGRISRTATVTVMAYGKAGEP